MSRHPHVINLAEMAWDKVNGPEGSPFGGERKRVGMKIGARKLGYSFFTVQPGMTAFPYHTHTGNEEMMHIIDGAATLRLGKDEIQVGAGDVIACPPGADLPHQLINTGATALTYWVVSTMEYPDISQYPDSNKIGAYANTAGGAQAGFRALYVRDKNVNYYEGENGEEVERILRTRLS
ncbi:MAG: putative auxin-binding protein [Deltaproteobacteria bacterium]|nr:putative auxin-binding protein [Deltaproteobacteria bacterium]